MKLLVVILVLLYFFRSKIFFLIGGNLLNSNEELAWKFIDMSAQAGYPEALYLMGNMYKVGAEDVGIECDKEKAFSYYLKAAQKGHLDAAVAVAMGYCNGECGQEMNRKAAKEWLEYAAERGSEHAKSRLEMFF